MDAEPETEEGVDSIEEIGALTDVTIFSLLLIFPFS
jgi:hypothetical protein